MEQQSSTGLSAAVLDGGPFTPALSPKPELVLLVGYPSMGKSTLYRKHFGPAGYEHISQDVLGNRTKCVKATGEALRRARVASSVRGVPAKPLPWQLIVSPSRQHE
jgi:hypothetical protein